MVFAINVTHLLNKLKSVNSITIKRTPSNMAPRSPAGNIRQANQQYRSGSINEWKNLSILLQLTPPQQASIHPIARLLASSAVMAPTAPEQRQHCGGVQKPKDGMNPAQEGPPQKKLVRIFSSLTGSHQRCGLIHYNTLPLLFSVGKRNHLRKEAQGQRSFRRNPIISCAEYTHPRW